MIDDGGKDAMESSTKKYQSGIVKGCYYQSINEWKKLAFRKVLPQ
ncbi:hypothetical protein [Streptococcus porcinus]|nr:hypothetical protein [Streptococcus porcinus]